jgi:hypothetical protein
VILISYLLATRDNMVDQKEEQFGRAVLRVLKLGLLLIILSGAVITVIHLSLGQVLVVLTPAFLFKWVIIGILLTTTLALGKKPYPAALYEGFLGANWYALFVIHVLAPLAAWADILVIYAIWSAGFMLAWAALVSGLRAPALAAAKKPRGHETVSAVPPPTKRPVEIPKPAPVAPKPAPVAARAASAPAPKAQTPPPKPPEPPKPAPVVIQTPPVPHKPEELPAPSLPAVARAVPPKPPVKPMEVPRKPAPVTDPDENPGLPAVRVMPRSPQDIETQTRASVVQFS